jgi:1,2-diacylglycerol 3-alpha-glucosyltransferase
MKICMFTNTYLPQVGGVARSVHLFAEDLRAMGHRVMIVAPTYAEQNGDDAGTMDVLRMPAIQHFNDSDFSVQIPLPFVINDAIRTLAPDIIHSHHPFLLGDAAMRAAHRRNLPLIFTHHTRYEDYMHYVAAESDSMRRFAIHLSTAYANLCHHVVAPSRSIAALLLERGVRTPVTTIPTGVDTRFFASGDGVRFRHAHHIDLRDPVIGHVGRLAPEKNLPYLARAVAQLVGGRPDTRFLVVGEGPAAEDVAEVFRSTGRAQNLLLVGRQTGRDLSDAYAAMDIFAFASRTETQGMVLVEAMASGKPVVALDASGVREVVVDGRNGRLLPGETKEEAFARALNALLEQTPTIRKEMQTAARRTAADFSRAHCAARLAELYASVFLELDRQKPLETAFTAWNDLRRAVRVEWNLISRKASAVAHAVKKSEKGADVERLRFRRWWR